MDESVVTSELRRFEATPSSLILLGLPSLFFGPRFCLHHTPFIPFSLQEVHRSYQSSGGEAGKVRWSWSDMSRTEQGNEGGINTYQPFHRKPSLPHRDRLLHENAHGRPRTSGLSR